MRIVPIGLKAANDFVEQWHRHSSRTNNDGGKWAIAAEHDGEIVGVAIVGRPVAQLLQGSDGLTAEITRCCVSDVAPKGTPSMLYQRCKRIWQLMGGTKISTYVLKREGGESMRNLGADGWLCAAQVKGGRQWDSASRRRAHKQIYEEPKERWDRLL